MLARATAFGLLGLLTGAGVPVDHGPAPIRLVLTASAAAAPASTLAATSLSWSHDPWRRYLASDRVCPGAERTDLPPRRQAASVACLVNFARRERGLARLATVGILNRASARKAAAIRRCERFAHNPCGGNWTASIRSTGYLGSFGENLYLASGPLAAPRRAVDAWLHSAPHRENLFRTSWRDQGLALVILPLFEQDRNVAVWVSVLGDQPT